MKKLGLGFALALAMTVPAFAGVWMDGAYKQWTYRVYVEDRQYVDIFWSDGARFQLPYNRFSNAKCSGFNCDIYEAGPRSLRVDYDPQSGFKQGTYYSFNP